MPSQIPLPLNRPSSRNGTRIILGNANQSAYNALLNFKDWPFNTAILTGPRRGGKSLLGSWAETQGITVIDRAECWDESELFHRWNRVQEIGVPLLLISNSQPWEIKLADLRSRLVGSLHLEISLPDDEMAKHLIEAIAEQLGLILADGASDYLVPRVERSFMSIEKLVFAIDQLSLERQVPATMSLWRAALELIGGPDQERLI
jgi:hypothetical protein